jgi:hypothetical protein
VHPERRVPQPRDACQAAERQGALEVEALRERQVLQVAPQAMLPVE